MTKREFAREMHRVRDTLIKLLAEDDKGQEKEIIKLFKDMIDQAEELKKVGCNTEMPKAFMPMGFWLARDRWYWSCLNDVRNAFIDYLELDLEKK